MTNCYEILLYGLHKITRCSLRSQRFQSSYCAKVRAEAKKRLKGEGEWLFFFFFRSCPSFLDEPREETLATQATVSVRSNCLDYQPQVFFPVNSRTCPKSVITLITGLTEAGSSSHPSFAEAQNAKTKAKFMPFGSDYTGNRGHQYGCGQKLRTMKELFLVAVSGLLLWLVYSAVELRTCLLFVYCEKTNEPNEPLDA